MRGVSEYIKEYKKILNKERYDKDFLSFHLTQIKFLQHERLVHLLVMLFVIICALIFMALFLLLDIFLFLVVFILLLVLTIFYILHYYKLENTVIEWYYIYTERVQKGEKF